ncbi:MAG: carboxyl transferase domain-containing protein, partial [Bacteroidota bacterium]
MSALDTVPSPLGSPLPDSPKTEARQAHMQKLLEGLSSQMAEIRRGGGEKAVQRMHARGKMTARERVTALLDEGSPFYEVGAFVGRGMYEDEGGCPAGGTVMGLGRVHG